jgi:hypothetical protein
MPDDRDASQIDPRIIADIDSLMEEYLNDNQLIHTDMAEASRVLFSAITWARKARTHRRKCKFPGCTATTIRTSHTLPRAASLAYLAEHGHVLTPEVRPPKGALAATLVGTGLASSFPGLLRRARAEVPVF